jgi:ribonuclease BN (tRNA processing enzyme)
VFISHGHPDHRVDLNPLLRARVLREDPAPALPVYALPGPIPAASA